MNMNTQARNAKVKIYIDQQLKISNSLSENDFTCLANQRQWASGVSLQRLLLEYILI